jgi:hypothetical protein
MVSVRLAPKLRYSAEIAARSQRRTLSSLIEVAVAAYLSRLDVEVPAANAPVPLGKLVDVLWDPDESDRFVILAERARWLLDLEEEHRWKSIRERLGAKERLTPEQIQRLRPIYKELKTRVADALHAEVTSALSTVERGKRGKDLF